MITIDGDKIIVFAGDVRTEHDIGSPEAFAILSRLWLRSGWDNKYVYSFTWMGRPIIQLPEDMIRIQELIYSLRPEVIVETGVAHGGSLVYYASLCKVMECGRVIGIDIDIRPHNRLALEEHPLSSFITLIEGNSIDAATIAKVKEQAGPAKNVLVLLDSSHSRDHVLAELRAYSPLVGPNSYIVATDGIMQELTGAPRSQPDWAWNNPRSAALEFLKENADFSMEEPGFSFNEGSVTQRVTYWPSAFLKRLR